MQASVERPGLPVRFGRSILNWASGAKSASPGSRLDQGTRPYGSHSVSPAGFTAPTFQGDVYEDNAASIPRTICSTSSLGVRRWTSSELRRTIHLSTFGSSRESSAPPGDWESSRIHFL